MPLPPRRLLLPLLLCCSLSAQTPLADAEEQRRRALEEAEQRQRLKDEPKVQLQAPESPAAADASLELPAETPSFRIEHLLLEVPDTGQWQGSLQAAWDNPLGCSDSLEAGFGHDLTRYREGSGSRDVSLGYRLPLGNWNLACAWKQSHFVQRIEGQKQRFSFSGSSRQLEFRAGRLLYRDQTCKTTLQLRTGQRSSRAFLDATELDVQRRNNSYVELALTHTQFLGRARLDLTAARRQGVSWFGAQEDLPTPDPGGPTFRYRLHTLEANLAAPFWAGGRSWLYSATLRGQHARDQVYASEYLGIASRMAVRGFDGGATLAAENGGFFRNELECAIGRGASLYLGRDAGRVHGANERYLAGRSLAGAVLGLKAALGPRGSFNVFVGGPLRQPAQFPNRWPVLGVSASFQL